MKALPVPVSVSVPVENTYNVSEINVGSVKMLPKVKLRNILNAHKTDLGKDFCVNNYMIGTYLKVYLVNIMFKKKNTSKADPENISEFRNIFFVKQDTMPEWRLLTVMTTYTWMFQCKKVITQMCVTSGGGDPCLNKSKKFITPESFQWLAHPQGPWSRAPPLTPRFGDSSVQFKS